MRSNKARGFTPSPSRGFSAVSSAAVQHRDFPFWVVDDTAENVSHSMWQRLAKQSEIADLPPCSGIAELEKTAQNDSYAVVSVLFAREDSIYKDLPGCDVYDIHRDARTWQGGSPVVAHPPCRAWGRLRALANPRPDEKALALFAVEQVRCFGGVLEHPAESTLWRAAKLPRPGRVDEFGGWTLPILQKDFGHRAEKATWLYIVGLSWLELPALPLRLGSASHICGTSGRRTDGGRLHKGDLGWRPEISKAEREHTPAELAVWLVEVARRCKVFTVNSKEKSGSYVIPGLCPTIGQKC